MTYLARFSPAQLNDNLNLSVFPQGPSESYSRVLAGPARLQVHPAEAGARDRGGEADGLQRDPLLGLQPDDGRVRQLRDTEVLRVRHARAEDHAGAEGQGARAAAGAADVRLQGHPEGARVDPARAAAGDRQGVGRARAQVRQGPEREPRRAEVHRVCRSQCAAGRFGVVVSRIVPE